MSSVVSLSPRSQALASGVTYLQLQIIENHIAALASLNPEVNTGNDCLGLLNQIIFEKSDVDGPVGHTNWDLRIATYPEGEDNKIASDKKAFTHMRALREYSFANPELIAELSKLHGSLGIESLNILIPAYTRIAVDEAREIAHQKGDALMFTSHARSL